jgi:hypothetical protein
LPQSRAQPQDPAEGLPHAPLGLLGAARFPGLRHDLPRLALPLGLRQAVALACHGELAGDMWVHLHVTHLLSVPLMKDSPGRGLRPGSWNENRGVARRSRDAGAC